MEHCQEQSSIELWSCRLKALLYDRSVVTPESLAASAFMDSTPKAKETAKRVTDEVTRQAALVEAEMKYEAYRRIEVDGVLQMPVLLYWGKNDPSALPVQAEELFNLIAETNPYARLQFINHAGHFPYLEHPEEFAHTVTSFIEYWSGPGAGKLQQ